MDDFPAMMGSRNHSRTTGRTWKPHLRGTHKAKLVKEK